MCRERDREREREREIMITFIISIIIIIIIISSSSSMLIIIIIISSSSSRRWRRRRRLRMSSEAGMVLLETLIELKLINSSFSSSNFSIRAFRDCPLIEIRQAVPCRAIRGKSSNSRQQYPSQQYPPPLS